MALILNQEQSMLRESALLFLKENAPVAQLRALRDRRDRSDDRSDDLSDDLSDDHGFSRDLWQHFAGMGFTGVLVPEAYGGLGLGQVEAGAIMEAIGRNLTSVPFFSTAILGAAMLARHGSAAQQERCLPSLARGQLLVALALDEGGRHAPQRVRLRAVADGGGYRLDGQKTFVVDGHVADLLIVAARTAGEDNSRDGITLFLVDGTAEGITRERTVMVDAHNAARIRFENVQVDASAVIGEPGQGGPLLDGTLDIGRAALAAELLGIAEEALERTQAYLKERRQFGQVIGAFQALQHRAASLYCEIEITRAAVLHAQQQLDAAPGTAAPCVSAAKARAGACATLAVQEAVQMHGGIGMTDEFEIGFFMKRARVVEELLGDARFHADRWGRLNGY